MVILLVSLFQGQKNMRRQKVEDQIGSKQIRAGYLLKRSKFLKQWRKRWVILTQNYLLTFTHDDCRQLTDVILLSTIQGYKSYLSKQNGMSACTFKITCVDSSVEEKWSWIVLLERLVKSREKNLSHADFLKEIQSQGFNSYNQFVLLEKNKTSNPNLPKILSGKGDEVLLEALKQQKIVEKEKEELERIRVELNEEKIKLKVQMAELDQEFRIRSKTIDTQNSDKQKRQSAKQNVKASLIRCIFEEFLNKKNYRFLKFYVSFLHKVVAEKKLQFQDIFLNEMLQEDTRKHFLNVLLGVFYETRKTLDLRTYLQFIVFLFNNVGKWLFTDKELANIQSKVIFEIKSINEKPDQTPELSEINFYLLKVLELVLEREKTQLTEDEAKYLLKQMQKQKRESKVEQIKEVAESLNNHLNQFIHKRRISTL